MPRITTNFQVGDAKLLNKADIIVSQMSNNPNFPAPVPSLDEIRNVKQEFENTLPAAETGDRETIAVKNEKREKLIGLLKRLAMYVELIADGNKAILLSSGYDLAKDPIPVGDLPKPENVKVTDGNNAGELQIAAKFVEGSRSYLFQYTAESVTPASVWNSIPSTKGKVLIKGLESGKKYWCRVAGVGSSTNLNFSEPISRIVQ